MLNVSEGTASSRIGATCEGLTEGCRPSDCKSGPLTSLTRRGVRRVGTTCSSVVRAHHSNGGDNAKCKRADSMGDSFPRIHRVVGRGELRRTRRVLSNMPIRGHGTR